MKRLYGITTALLTPFDASGRLDVPALKEHCDFLLSAGVHCLYPLGTTGEVFMMDAGERKRVAELVVEHVAGRAPVFIHVGAIPTTLACELAKHAEAIGADGAGAVTPYYFNVSQQEMKEYYLEIARSVNEDFPLYLYNLPGCTTNDLLPKTVKELAGVRNIVGIKSSVSDFFRIVQLLNGAPESFDVIQGFDGLLMPSLLYGAKGSVSGNSNVVPEMFVKLFNAMQAKDYEAARKCQDDINGVIRLLGPGGMACFKEALAWRGLRKTYTRQPLMGMDAKEAQSLRREFEGILGGRPAARQER
jgi:4-hydroxy-tetrahydrodipicolinate synthase